MIVGHALTLAGVPDPLPPMLLLTGPEGVGKRKVALELAERTGVRGLDFQNLGRLTKASSRELIEHHSMAPLSGKVKVTVADLTRASSEAVNSILKVLEEPPSYSHIILHTDDEPLLTIKSRCFNLRFGTLTDTEVAQVLEILGISDPIEAARFSQGRVSVALDYAANNAARKSAEEILVAVLKGDTSQVEQALSRSLASDKNLKAEQNETRRVVLCRMLAKSLRTSLSQSGHALEGFPLSSRLRALDILDEASRPALRIRSAVWVLMGA